MIYRPDSAVKFGTYRLRMALLRRVAPRFGGPARFLRYPNPLQVPWRQPIVEVARDAGIGDVLMCTPILREIKRRRPDCYIRFYTQYVSLLRGLPYIDEVLPTNGAGFYLEYASSIPSPLHLSRLMGNSIGLSVRDLRPDCVIDRSLVERFQESWRALPRPYIVVSRQAGNWTPNKQWPERYWTALVDRLSRSATVIEIGSAAGNTTVRQTDVNYVDLRGRTSLSEFVAAVAAADLHIGPPSSPVHIAAAARKRSVVIVGGYEGPTNTAYPEDIVFYTPVECAPCWLREPCPYNLKCLNAISPDRVEAALWSLWDKRLDHQMVAKKGIGDTVKSRRSLRL